MPYIQLQFRRDTSENWSCSNPLLASGEMGIELDTRRFKIGDGCLHWNNLPYGGLQGPPGPAGGTSGTGGVSSTGPTGPQGPQGLVGATGATGPGVPPGGSAGQVLAKINNANYSTQWVNTTGQTGPTGAPGGVTSIVAGTNVTINPSNGLGAVTINASGGGSLTTYIIKVQTASSGTYPFGPGWSVLAAQDSNSLSLLSNGWEITAPTTPSNPGSIAGSTYLSIVYPVSFTGSFTNFRRAIPGTTPGSWLFSAITATSAISNIAIVSQSTRTIVIGPISLSATGWAANQINYFVFDYLPISILI